LRPRTVQIRKSAIEQKVLRSRRKTVVSFAQGFSASGKKLQAIICQSLNNFCHTSASPHRPVLFAAVLELKSENDFYPGFVTLPP
jgi:hypothetical protein